MLRPLLNRSNNLYLLNMVKIAVLDNHALYRIGLITVLRNDPRFEVIGDFSSSATIHQILPSLPFDILFADIPVNDSLSWEALRNLKRIRTIKVMYVSFSKDEFEIAKAMAEGVDAFIQKDCEPEEIVLGINKVLAGQRFYSSDISNILLSSAYKRQYKGVPFLTSKEKEIIRYLMEGYSSKQIAARLEVSPRTIDTHRANILSKFNLRNTSELISKIADQKILL